MCYSIFVWAGRCEFSVLWTVLIIIDIAILIIAPGYRVFAVVPVLGWYVHRLRYTYLVK